jgi:hypothetical protein
MLLLGSMLTFALLVAVPLASAGTNPPGFHYKPADRTATWLVTRSETMPAFLNGSVVSTKYEQGYFTGNITGTNSTYGMEPLVGQAAVGATTNAQPSNASGIDPMWVLVPWFGPASAPYAPAYNPGAYHIKLMCAPATVAVCWDHPATIYVPGLGVVPLPGHDHLISTANNGIDEWWLIYVVLVTNKSAFPNLAGTTGINSLTALRSAQAAGMASSDLPTNVYLNFAVAPYATVGGQPVQSKETKTLEGLETMPTFFAGKLYNSFYEQGYFTGSTTGFNGLYGMQPLTPQAALGVFPNVLPAPQVDIEQLWVLVPWWGPASTPYAPAYNPAAYGIQVQCAPATVSVCYDHPATIFVPGLGVVPLPGHDHLVSTVAQHVNIWWHVRVALVLNQSAWPTQQPSGNWTGITSVPILRADQKAGMASNSISTNFYLDFTMGGVI